MHKAPAFFIPFSIRNYRLWFAGQLVSLTGTFMTFTALSWVVYDLTKSPVMLGIFAVANQAPTILASPFAGVWVDRLNRQRLLKVTQTLSALQSATLAILAFTRTLTIGLILALCVFQGVVNAFDLPTRQAMVSQIAEKREHLPAVIGMNSTMFNLGRMLGPAIGGVLLSFWGAGACFLIDTFSYLAVLAALAAMTVKVNKVSEEPLSVLEDLREGFAYSLSTVPIRYLMLSLAWISTFGISFGVMNPAFARDVFRGDAHVLGWLMAASAFGSVVGALRTASRIGIERLGRGMVIGTVLLAAGLASYSISRNLFLSMASLFVTGMGSVTFVTSSNALIQNIVEEDKRGRVMSWYGLCFQGGFPVGGLIIGIVASRTGVNAAVGLWAVLVFLTALYLWLSLPWLVKRAKQLLIQQADQIAISLAQTIEQ